MFIDYARPNEAIKKFIFDNKFVIWPILREIWVKKGVLGQKWIKNTFTSK